MISFLHGAKLTIQAGQLCIANDHNRARDLFQGVEYAAEIQVGRVFDEHASFQSFHQVKLWYRGSQYCQWIQPGVVNCHGNNFTNLQRCKTLIEGVSLHGKIANHADICRSRPRLPS